ncbi:MAG: hypothetical protein Tsb005_07760 [Gammaproteobacteria bacterium]
MKNSNVDLLEGKQLGFNIHDIDMTGIMYLPPSRRGLNAISITPDNHGEYTIPISYAQYSYHCTYIDGHSKIAAISYFNNKLYVELYTSKQVNLLADITLTDCVIVAQGPVCCYGTWNVDNKTSFDTASLGLHAKFASKNLFANVKQGIGFFNQINTDNLIIAKTQYCYLAAKSNIIVTNFLQVQSAWLQQQRHAFVAVNSMNVTVVNKLIVSGEFVVYKQAQLVCNTLNILAINNTHAKLEFNHHFSVQIHDCTLAGNAALQLNAQECHKKVQFYIKDAMQIDTASTVKLNQVHVGISKIINYGTLDCKNAEINTNKILQLGSFKVDSTKVESYQLFQQSAANDASYGFKEPVCELINNSTMYSAQSTVSRGKVVSHASKWQVNNLSVEQAEISVASNSILLSYEDIVFFAESKSNFDNATVWANNECIFDGLAVMRASCVSCKKFCAYEQPLVIKEFSIIEAAKSLTINANASIDEARLTASHVFLYGSLNINALNINADYLTVDSDQCDMSYSVLKAGILDFKNTQRSKVHFTINTSEIVTQILTVATEVEFKTSEIKGVGDSSYSHTIAANMRLEESDFIFAGQLYLMPAKKISLKNNSSIQANNIYSKGDLELDNSKLATNYLTQMNANSNFTSSEVKIFQVAFSKNSQSNAKQKTIFLTNKAYLDNFSLADGSQACFNHLHIKHTLDVLKADLKIQEQAIWEIGSRVTIQHSIAEYKLLRSGAYADIQHSKLSVTTDLELMPASDSNLERSVISNQNMAVYGKLNAYNSALETKNKIVYHAGARINLLNAFIASEDLKNQTKITILPNQSSSNDEKIISQLLIKNNFENDGTGVIEGQALHIQVKNFHNRGKIELQKLNATGQWLINWKNISAKQLYLGFDGAVINILAANLSAEEATIHSSLLNLLSKIGIKHYCIIQGIFNLNLGLIAANNYSNDSLVSANFGLTTPNLTASLKYIFSKSNLINGARQLIQLVFPAATTTVNLVWSAGSLAYSAYYKIPQLCNVIKNHGEKGTIRVHQLVSILCEIKNLLLPTWNLVKGDIQHYQNRTNFPAISADIFYKMFIPNFTQTHWSEITFQTIGTLLGQHSDTSLLNVNMGIHLATNSHKLNLANYNLGVSATAFSENISSYYNYNAGVDIASYSAFTATTLKNKGKILSWRRLYLNTENLHNQGTGKIWANMAIGEVLNCYQYGELNLGSGNLKIINFIDGKDAKTFLTYITYKGEQFTLKGYLNAKRVDFNLRKIQFEKTAIVETQENNMTAEEFVDASNMQVTNWTQVITDNYKHTGSITNGTDSISPDMNIFILQAEKAELTGRSDIAHGYYDIKQLSKIVDFIVRQGQYENYYFNQSLNVNFPSNIHIKVPVNRDCDLTITGLSIKWEVEHNKPSSDLVLISTQGDVVVLKAMVVGNFKIISAHDILTNKTNNATIIDFKAEGRYTNLGGIVSGEFISIKASEIINLHKNTEIAKQGWGYNIGYDGRIESKQGAILEATRGNIENHGGVIKDLLFLKLTAAGDVLNVCQIKNVKGKYDVMKMFTPGIIEGGNGITTDGIGLYIYAGGNLIAQGSYFTSFASNCLDIQQNIFLKAEWHTYLADITRKSKYFGLKTTKYYHTETQVQPSIINSQTGANYMRAKYGKIESEGNQIIGPQGNFASCAQTLKLYTLVFDETVIKKSHCLIFNSTSEDHFQKAIPTLIADDQLTHLESFQEDVILQSVMAVGLGDLSIKAGNKIIIENEILNNYSYQKSYRPCFELPLATAWQALSSGNIKQGFYALDPTLASMAQLTSSHTLTEYLANSVAAGVHLYNSAHNLAQGYMNNTLLDELYARYNLGYDGHFSPSINIGLQRTTCLTEFQTVMPSVIERGGDIYFSAPNRVEFLNGATVKCQGNMFFDTPNVLLQAAALHGSMRQSSTQWLTNVLPLDVMADGLSYRRSQQHMHWIIYQNAQAMCDGTIYFTHQGNAVNSVTLDGGNMHAGVSIQGDIENLFIIDKQDTINTHAKQLGLGTAGQVNKVTTTTLAQQVNQHSGMKAGENLDVVVNALTLHGGQTIAGNDNTLPHANTIVAMTLSTINNNKTRGFSVNVKDWLSTVRALESTYQPGMDVIKTLNIIIVDGKQLTTFKPVMSGANVTAEVNQQPSLSNVHTVSDDSTQWLKNTSRSLSIVIPYANQHEFINAQQVFEQAWRAFAKTHTHVSNVVMMTVTDDNAQLVYDVLPNQTGEQAQAVNEYSDQAVATILPDEHVLNTAAQHVAELPVSSINAGNHYDSTNQANNDLGTDLIHLSKALAEQQWHDAFPNDPHATHKSPVLVKFNQVAGQTLISFAFNIALSNANTTEQKLYDAAIDTGVELSFDYGISKIFKFNTLGAVSWTLLEIADRRYYAAAANFADDLVEFSLNDCQRAIEHGRWNVGDICDGVGAAIIFKWLVKGGHLFISLPDKVSNYVKDKLTTSSMMTNQPHEERYTDQLRHVGFFPASSSNHTSRDIESVVPPTSTIPSNLEFHFLQ